LTRFSASSSTSYAGRSEQHLSPKGALSWQLSSDAFVKYAVGRAVRMPTVNELYGATSTTNAQYINDPNLRPERSWTQELSYEKTLDHHQWRLTAFAENTRDGIYSQTVFDSNANTNVSRVQNVGYIVTRGLEGVYNGYHLWLPGLDLSASVTYADSTIRENDGFVTTPGDALGKRQPNIPRLARHFAHGLPLEPRMEQHRGRAPQRPAIQHAEQQRHQWLRLHRREPLHYGGCAGALANRPALDGGLWHRQPHEPDLLELPPLPTTQLHGRTQGTLLKDLQ